MRNERIENFIFPTNWNSCRIFSGILQTGTPLQNVFVLEFLQLMKIDNNIFNDRATMFHQYPEEQFDLIIKFPSRWYFSTITLFFLFFFLLTL